MKERTQMQQKEVPRTGAKFLIKPDAPCNGLLAEKIQRNEPCNCGSGKKAKKCCGTQTLYKNREMKKNNEPHTP